MSSNQFVHLHVHSEYSLLEASSGVKDLAVKASEMGMPALALTDNGNMFGAIEFYFACLDKGIKPIIGLDTYLVGDRNIKGQDRNEIQRPPTRLVLLASSLKGYQNLCQISSLGYKEGFYYKPRIDYDVLKNFNEDVIALSGGLRGEIPQTFLTEGKDYALDKIRKLKDLFSDRLYLEINRTGLPQWKEIGSFLQEASKITSVPLVAANDVHYLTQDDQMSQEVLICIGTNKTLQDESRFRLGTDQFYLKSADEMRSLFPDMPEACDRTLEIAERVNVKFKLKDDKGKPIYHLPSFATPEGSTTTDEIRRLALEGLEVRFQEASIRKEVISEESRKGYFSRLDFELSVIDRMGF